jgi:hypothetical protein
VVPDADALEALEADYKKMADDVSGRVAVGLPGQGGSDTNAERDQEAGEGPRGSSLERRPSARELVIFQVGPVDMRHGQRAFGGLELSGVRYVIHPHLSAISVSRPPACNMAPLV